MSLATAPHKADNAGRTWLELDPERCKKEIQKANALGLRLIGYWHTHPQVIPQISSADISSFSRFAQRYSQVLPHPVAIIVGTSPDTSGIKAWLFREGGYFEAVRMDCPF
ncbi:Mov34/MPN/PAD-1 family protein [Citrobacter portucalensis]